MPSSDAPEIIYTENKSVSCDGGGGSLGHPKIYLNMGDKSEIVCPYCSRQFRLKEINSAYTKN